jgi:hypothetical protein
MQMKNKITIKFLKFLMCLFVLGCAAPRYPVFSPTDVSFEISRPVQSVYAALKESFPQHFFKILSESKENHTIVVTSKQSAVGKTGLAVGKLLTGISYEDRVAFVIIPKGPGTQLLVSMVAFQKAPGIIEQIPIDSTHEIFRRVNALVGEISK